MSCGPNGTGQRAAWNDAARLWDDKWQRVFEEVIPRAQRHVARLLRLPDPASVAFAPNTHEFVRRLLSACPPGVMRVLTTDGEFRSFARQVARLEEDGLARVERVPVQPCPGAALEATQAQFLLESAWCMDRIAGGVGALGRVGARSPC